MLREPCAFRPEGHRWGPGNPLRLSHGSFTVSRMNILVLLPMGTLKV